MNDGRRRHYGTFYGVDPLPDDGRPLLVVLGNCQAESVRVLLAGPSARVDGGSDRSLFATVRIPPVHELVAADLPHLRALLTRTAVLLSQPVRSGYRELPIGTEDCASLLPPGAALLRFPIIRHLGLHPYQAIVRPPDDPSVVPPLVAYHDLRVMAAVRDGVRTADVPARAAAVEAGPQALRAVGETSLAELARREAACDVAVSDLIPSLGAEAVHTVNHPGNALLIALARRVQHTLGVTADAADPGRELLGGVRAPLAAQVLAALDLLGPGRDHWLVDGVELLVEQVVRAHLSWYAEHPQVVPVGLARHAERVTLLGL